MIPTSTCATTGETLSIADKYSTGYGAMYINADPTNNLRLITQSMESGTYSITFAKPVNSGDMPMYDQLLMTQNGVVFWVDEELFSLIYFTGSF